MTGFIDFLVDNYLIFLLITLVLIFALIGYLVESKKGNKDETLTLNDADDKEKTHSEIKDKSQEEVLEEIKGMKNISINTVVNETKNDLTPQNTTTSSTEELQTEIPQEVENTPPNNLATEGEIIGNVPSVTPQDEILDNITNSDEQ